MMRMACCHAPCHAVRLPCSQDKNPGSSQAVHQFQQIGHAFRVLSDPQQRQWVLLQDATTPGHLFLKHRSAELSGICRPGHSTLHIRPCSWA